jgi:ABC-type lipoprotein release transport system permease subunit
MVCVPLALLTIAALACLAPGRRAGRLDPAEVLREG